jgi:hypothetical protein
MSSNQSDEIGSFKKQFMKPIYESFVIVAVGFVNRLEFLKTAAFNVRQNGITVPYDQRVST